jgi:hypothetical protein
MPKFQKGDVIIRFTFGGFVIHKVTGINVETRNYDIDLTKDYLPNLGYQYKSNSFMGFESMNETRSELYDPNGKHKFIELLYGS